MNSIAHHATSELESVVAEKYRREGFEVIIEPQSEDLPFDLGLYRPDLVVRKPNDGGYIVEVKDSARRVPVERYQEVAETVSQHSGWRFLLITGDDAVPGTPEELEGRLPSWEQLHQRQEKASRLISLGESEGAFISLWGMLEALMRKRAVQVLLPIDRLPTSSLIKHLYSQGELSMGQFDEVDQLQGIRNRLVHGLEVSELDEPLIQLQGLVSECYNSWKPS